MKKIFLVFVLLVSIGSVNAFFETSSNNIIVTNNLFNGTINLSSLYLEEIYLNGTNINDIYVPYTGAINDLLMPDYDITANNIKAYQSGFESYAKIISRPDMFYGLGYGNEEFTIDNYGNIYNPDGLIETGRSIEAGTDITAGNDIYAGNMIVAPLIVAGDLAESYYWSEGGYSEIFGKDGVNAVTDFWNDNGGDVAFGLRYTDNMFMIGTDYLVTDETGLNMNMDKEFGLGVLPTAGYKLVVDGIIANPSTNADDFIFTNLYTSASHGFKFKGYDGLALYPDLLDLSFIDGADFQNLAITTTGLATLGNGIINGNLNMTDGNITNINELYADKITIKGRKVLDDQYWSNEFICAYGYCQGFWYAANLNSGATSVWALYVDANHPGVNYIRASGVAANSGAWILTSTSNFLIAGGEQQHFIIKPISSVSTIQGQLGFWDSQTNPTDSTMFLYENGAFFGVTESNSVKTTTATNYTPSDTSWLNLYLTINDDATEVLFEIYDSPQTTLLWNDTITTNLPTSAGRVVGNGITYIETSGTYGSTLYMVALDFMDLEINRVFDR